MGSRMPAKTSMQQGVALVFTMVFLGLMIVTGLTAIQFSSFQQKMATNFQNHQSAFIAAEEALREAERCVENDLSCSNITTFTATCNNGLCFTGSDRTSIILCRTGNNPSWRDAALWRDTSRTRAATTLTGAGTSARYIIEFICYTPSTLFGVIPSPTNPADWSGLYRITALASVDNVNSRVMLQSTYRR